MSPTLLSGEYIICSRGWLSNLSKKLDRIIINRIVVFENPLRGSAFDHGLLVKRCVAVSGDIIQSNLDEVFVNRDQIISLTDGLIDVLLYIKPVNIDSVDLSEMKISSCNRVKDLLLIRCICTDSTVKKFRESYSSFLKIEIVEPYLGNLKVLGSWKRIRDMELAIPYSGMEVDVNHEFVEYYSDLANHFENQQIMIENGVLYCCNSPINSFDFKKNYCFLLGDNHEKSIDSRCFGPIPMDLLKSILIFENLQK